MAGTIGPTRRKLYQMRWSKLTDFFSVPLSSPLLPPPALPPKMSDAITPASRQHLDEEHEKHSEHSSTDAEELAAKGHHGPAFYAQADEVPKTAGVLRIEAVARAKNTKSGRRQLYIIGACVVLMYFVRPGVLLGTPAGPRLIRPPG